MRQLLVSSFALLILSTSPLAAGDGHSGGCFCGNSGVPTVSIEADFPSSGPYAAAARTQLELWNRYINIFSHRTGTDFVAGVNGKAEVVAFDAATAEEVYGIETDATVFGFAYMSPMSAFGNFDACPRPVHVTCGTFGETDVIVNADFERGWTSQGPPDFDDNNGPAYFQATVAHEVGHTLGFHHNFSNISIMNYYEDFAAQYIALSDVLTARQAYPNHVRQVTDMAIYPFWFDATKQAYDAAFPVLIATTQVQPGQQLTFRNFTVENLSTGELRNVEVLFYLTKDGTVANSEDIFLGGVEYDRFPAAAYDEFPDNGSLVVPAQTPAGQWRLGAIVAVNRQLDAIAYNNQWVSPQTVTVSVPSSGGRRRGVRR